MQKYYVVYEENDTELSEDEECTKKEDREVLDVTSESLGSILSTHQPPPSLDLCHHQHCRQVGDEDVAFQRLGRAKVSSDTEDDSGKEDRAKQINTGAKDLLV